jgi:hypothetical protein
MSLGLEATPQAAAADPASRRGFFPGGWAYVAMVALYPLWWALGIGAFTWSLRANPMAAHLYHQRPIRVPRGTGLMVLFLLCVLVSVIQIDSPDRLAGYFLRTSYYLAAAVTWLYLINNEQRLSSHRVLRALIFLWGASVVGGYLGLLFSDVSWSGPAAGLIPEGLRTNDLIRDLVNPGFAEVNQIIGVRIARPKAPFTYTNGWGSAMALLTPLALAALASPEFSRRAKQAIRLCLLASAVPIVLSLNRGLWALLLLGGLYVVVRRSPGGRSRTTAMVFLALLAIATTLLATSLGDPIRESLDTRGEDSNERRTIIYEETFARTLESPVLGYGAPRPSERTEQSVGSHGQVWTVMFSHGFLAAALFVALLSSMAWRSRNPVSMTAVWYHVTLVIGLVQMVFYGQLPHQLFIIVSVAALAHRAAGEPAGEPELKTA